MTSHSHVNVTEEAIEFIRDTNVQGAQHEVHVLQTNGNTGSLELVKGKIQHHVLSVERRDKSLRNLKSAAGSFGRAKVVSKLGRILLLTVQPR